MQQRYRTAGAYAKVSGLKTEAERDEYPAFCFTYRGEPIAWELTNSAWQHATRLAATRSANKRGPAMRLTPYGHWQAVSGHPSTYPFVLLSFMACALEIAIGMTASTAAL